jgi:mRNA-degrading endonuclease RelE of RelBE toxin-antitoxin system
MTYSVLYTAHVTAQIEKRIDSLRSQHVSEPTIERWFGRLFDAIDDLYERPRRFPVDLAESQRRGYPVRKLIFGDYIIRYRIDESNRAVYVMSFIHGSRVGESG